MILVSSDCIMKDMIKKWLFVFLLLLICCFPNSAKAKECNEGDPRLDEICRELNKASEEYAQLSNALSGAKKSLSELESQINGIQSTINSAKTKVKTIEKELLENEIEMEFQKQLLYARVKDWYIESRKVSPLFLFLSSENLNEAIKQVNYRKAAGEQDKKIIISVSAKINKLNSDKESLEKKSTQLASLQANLDTQADSLRGDIKGAESYSQSLTQKISELTAEQQSILAEKTGVFTTTVGETPGVDDPCAGPPGSSNFCSPGFSPAFGGFSFGAPHRKGMSQYGAYGRAKSGQNFETILKAYYGDIRIETISSPGSIATSVGSLPFEDNYLLGIAEMPSSWGDKGGAEALKAQAIAARSYALSYTGWRMSNQSVQKSICTTEACQVYNSSKASNVPDTWKRAVDETRGKIVVSNQTGEIISTWYASTAGGAIYSYTTLGHTTNALWDTSCGNQGCWPDQAYEKVSGSPWFYKGWYKTRSGKSCDRSNPWMTQDEFADLINAMIVYKNDQGSLGHLSQTDSCWGTVPDTWSKDEVRNQSAKYNGPVSQINNVGIDYSGDGVTANVKVQTDKGEFTFTGELFKTIFNLRAPGAIHIKSMLFNLVRI
jgi:peptidoglycan hydrolase CwlO-like protein